MRYAIVGAYNNIALIAGVEGQATEQLLVASAWRLDHHLRTYIDSALQWGCNALSRGRKPPLYIKRCGHSSMVEPLPSKQKTRVRFPLPAPAFARFARLGSTSLL
jgi:hypothetical protein